jgi:hypothetical protein
MWLGVLYLDAGETDACGGEAAVLLLAWEDGRVRPLTVGAPLDAVAHIAHLLRLGAMTAPVIAPRCDACDTPLELPLD